MCLPARGGYARLARIGAASIALRLGCPLRVIDDLRLALDEAMILLLDSADPSDQVIIEYDTMDSQLVVDLHISPGRSISPSAADRFSQMTDGLIDTTQVDAAGGAVSLRRTLPT